MLVSGFMISLSSGLSLGPGQRPEDLIPKAGISAFDIRANEKQGLNYIRQGSDSKESKWKNTNTSRANPARYIGYIKFVRQVGLRGQI